MLQPHSLHAAIIPLPEKTVQASHHRDNSHDFRAYFESRIREKQNNNGPERKIRNKKNSFF